MNQKTILGFKPKLHNVQSSMVATQNVCYKYLACLYVSDEFDGLNFMHQVTRHTTAQLQSQYCNSLLRFIQPSEMLLRCICALAKLGHITNKSLGREIC